MQALAFPILSGSHCPIGIGCKSRGAGSEVLRKLGYAKVRWKSLHLFGVWPEPKDLGLHVCADFTFPGECDLVTEWV